jgi:enoyl-CoA hydratase/carnithine racemase
MSERVVYTIDENGVADVRLDRPEKMNAIDSAMFAGIAETGKKLAADKSLRAVVLSGNGRAFSAGLDFESFLAMADSKGKVFENSLFDQAQDGPANFAQLAGYVWHDMPVPVIAAMHGVAYGGGLQIALGADIRIVAPDAKLAIFEINWGLVPDMSGTQTLRRFMPLDKIKELTYTGRVISGSEALKLGMATRLSDEPYRDAMELAQTIASKSPSAVRAAKKLLNAAGLVSLEEGLKLEAELQRSVIGKPNQVEAVRANMENRPPKFIYPE